MLGVILLGQFGYRFSNMFLVSMKPAASGGCGDGLHHGAEKATRVRRMTNVEVRRIRPQQKRHAIFISAGDRETFASHALDSLTDTFDVLIFQYGISPAKRERFERDSIFFASGSGTKFNALKEIFTRHRDLLLRYDTVWACDDDLVPETGDLRLLPVAAMALGIAVLSPAHSIWGKISYPIMLPVLGQHALRYTSYVEMGFVLFQTKSLALYLDAYDGSLQGFADDWWFANFLKTDKRAIAAVVDIVTVINPHNHQKPGGHGEIDLLGPRDELALAWHTAMKSRGFREWEPRTYFQVRIDPAGISAMGYRPSLFQRTWGATWQVFQARWNYRARFYRLRKRILRLTRRLAAS